MLNQPRKVFDKEKLNELADSIKEQGVLQPILVVKDENGYTIVAGERRWRAAKLANLTTIPAIIKDYTDTRKKQVALIENIQREDLNIVEVAKAIKELMEIDGYTQADVSKLTGKNLSTISNIMRLLKLQEDILNLLLEGKLVEGQARALLAVENHDKQLDIAKKAIEKKLTVRDVEKLVYGADDYKRGKTKKQPKNIYYKKIEEKIENFFGYKTKIDISGKNQKLIVEYNDAEGLESILNKLKIKI
jgi:ParB family chromosome partitioning protein